MKGMPTTWWTADRLAEFWGYVKWFMKYNMPIFMIVAAVIVASIVLTMIVNIPLQAKEAMEKQDDNDFDVKYY